MGTYTLLEVAKSYFGALSPHKKTAFRFVYVSTDEVYGDLGNEKKRFTESSCYRPSSPYSASKAAADHLVHAWYQAYGLPVIVTHAANCYGCYQYPEKLIPKIIINALQEKPLPVYGNGMHVRNWLYVDDHARVIRLVLESGKVGEVYNIGAREELTNLEVVKKICEILDDILLQSCKYYHSLIRFVNDRPGHDQRYDIDSRKIIKKLHWARIEAFDVGIRKTIEWYVENSRSIVM